MMKPYRSCNAKSSRQSSNFSTLPVGLSGEQTKSSLHRAQSSAATLFQSGRKFGATVLANTMLPPPSSVAPS